MAGNFVSLKLVWLAVSGPEPPLATTSNVAARPVIAAIRAERSILSAQTSVCGTFLPFD
jgi:hypothetical protein